METELIGSLENLPHVYLQQLPARKDVRGLNNDHRLLHAWAAELKSLSPTTMIGNGWTLQLIVIAHDKVVDLLKQLKPDYNHTSPIGAATWKTPVSPIMVKEAFVSVVGSRLTKDGSDLDLVIATDEPDERIEAQLSKQMGESVHIIYDQQGAGERPSSPLFHLMLVPVNWERKIGVDEAITAALSAYESELNSQNGLKISQYRRILGAGLLKRKITIAMSKNEAEKIGIEAAGWALTDKRPVPFVQPVPKPLLAASWRTTDLFDVAVEVYAGMMIPVENAILYAEGVELIKRQIDEWVENDPFKNIDEALDAARELGNKIADVIKKKLREQTL